MSDLYDAALDACAGIDARTRFAAVIHMDDEGDMTVWCSQNYTDDREEVARLMRLAVKTVAEGDEVE